MVWQELAFEVMDVMLQRWCPVEPRLQQAVFSALVRGMVSSSYRVAAQANRVFASCVQLHRAPLGAPIGAVMELVMCTMLRSDHLPTEHTSELLELLRHLFEGSPSLVCDLMANFDCVPHGMDLVEDLVCLCCS